MTQTSNVSEEIIHEVSETSKVPVVITLLAVVISIGLASSPLYSIIQHGMAFKPLSFPSLSIKEWVNQGLMGVFFLLVAIELREALSQINYKTILYPFAGACFGMLCPALIFYCTAKMGGFSPGLGWSVPTTTDIAFALALLSFFPGIPPAVRQFVLFLAVFDDLMGLGILVVLFQGLPTLAEVIPCLLLTALAVLCFFAKRRAPFLWVVMTIALWFALLKAHLFPEIAGLITGSLMASQTGKTFEHYCAGFVAFLVIPVFAFVNTFINLSSIPLVAIYTPAFLGVFFGLLLGKPLGVISAVSLLRACKIPLPWRDQVHSRKQSLATLCAIGSACGIGFTMSLFFADLAFQSAFERRVTEAAVVIASVGSAALGGAFLCLAKFSKK